MKLNLSITLFSILFSTNIFGSVVVPMDYSSIEKRATHIFIGYVVSTTENLPKDICNNAMYDTTIKITTTLKGIDDDNKFLLPVCIGNRGFNRNLIQGKHYIFFLNKRSENYYRVHSTGAVGEF